MYISMGMMEQESEAGRLRQMTFEGICLSLPTAEVDALERQKFVHKY